MALSRILFVDDEDVIRRLCRRVLEPRCSELIVAATVKDALEIINSHELDFLISDLRLPDGGGPDIIGAFNKKFPGRPVLLITGFMEAGEIGRQIAALTVTETLHKPFDLSKFEETVEAMLTGRGPLPQ